jgi:D-alanyl-D-alanine carboxypeptidase
MRRLTVVALAVAVAAAGVVVGATQRDDHARTVEAAAEEVVGSGVPGVLVRLRDGDDVRELARGGASPRDRFRVGSVTKTFVAALTVTLADAGTLSLEDPVSRHLAPLLDDGDRITVRDLLAHTSHLGDYADKQTLRDSELAPRALVTIVNGWERAEGDYSYSSTNYLVLGLVLEAAARMPLDRLLRRHVFERFGLADTTFEPGRVRGRYLHGHERALRDGIATGRYRDTDGRSARSAWAAGAAVSTAADLDRFFTRLLASELGRRMEPQGDARYGLGLARVETGCGKAVGHTGNVLGSVTVVWARGDRVLVVAANVYPMTPAQEAAFQTLLARAFCG